MSTATLSLDDRKKFGALVATAWSDPRVAARYQLEPLAVLAEHRIELAHGATAPSLPPAPLDDIRDEDLVLVAGGGRRPAALDVRQRQQRLVSRLHRQHLRLRRHLLSG